MDGIALASAAATAGRRRYLLQGMQAAGDAPLTLASTEHCIEIMTGAMLPTGCDCVVPVERITVEAGRVELQSLALATPWKSVHRRASDQRQGALLLGSGTVLHPPEIAVAASAGMARLRGSGPPLIVAMLPRREH